MLAIRFRNLVRRWLGVQIRAETEEQGYLLEYPWLEQLWPLGLSPHWDKGIKFEKLELETFAAHANGWLYLLDKDGKPLAMAKLGWSSETLDQKIHRAIRKLRVDQSRVRFIVRVFFKLEHIHSLDDGSYDAYTTYLMRIHRVPRGQTLLEYLQPLEEGARKIKRQEKKNQAVRHADKQRRLKKAIAEARAEGRDS